MGVYSRETAGGYYVRAAIIVLQQQPDYDDAATRIFNRWPTPVVSVARATAVEYKKQPMSLMCVSAYRYMYILLLHRLSIN